VEKDAGSFMLAPPKHQPLAAKRQKSVARISARSDEGLSSKPMVGDRTNFCPILTEQPTPELSCTSVPCLSH
jgi:hypothetical protein